MKVRIDLILEDKRKQWKNLKRKPIKILMISSIHSNFRIIKETIIIVLTIHSQIKTTRRKNQLVEVQKLQRIHLILSLKIWERLAISLKMFQGGVTSTDKAKLSMR